MRLWFNIHSVAQYQKKLKGDPLEALNNFRKKRILNSLIVPKNEKRILGFFIIHSVAKYRKIEGERFGDIKKFSKSHNVEKTWKGDLLVSSGFVRFVGKVC